MYTATFSSSLESAEHHRLEDEHHHICQRDSVVCLLIILSADLSSLNPHFELTRCESTPKQKAAYLRLKALSPS